MRLALLPTLVIGGLFLPDTLALDIASASQYSDAMRDTAWVAAAEAETVNLTWAAISDDQLNALLSSKRTVAALRISGATALTTLSPGLDNLNAVTGDVSLTALPALETLELPALRSVRDLIINVGGTGISLPSLTQATGRIQLDGAAVVDLDLSGLTSVGLTFAINLVRLSGAGVTAGLPALRTVGGAFHLNNVGWFARTAITDIVMPELRSVGSLIVAQARTAAISAPLLHTISGEGSSMAMSWYHCPWMRHFNVPALRVLRGRVRFIALEEFSTLCSFGLPETGFTGSSFTISRCPNLVMMPEWIATLASVDGASECSGHPSCLISSAADYSAAMSNTTWVLADAAGQVIISWAGISDAQLNALLRRKTSLTEMVLEDATAITSLSPALDALERIGTRLILNNLPALEEAELVAITSIGGSATLTNNRAVTSIAMPSLVSIGHTATLENNVAVRTMDFSSLITANGSLTFRNLPMLGPGEVSTAFSSLRTVRGALSFHGVCWGRTPPPDRELSFAALETIGSLILRESRFGTVACPAVTAITATVNLYGMNELVEFDFPSLETMGGRFQVTACAAITSLCEFRVPQSGMSGPIAIGHSVPLLMQMPAWMAVNASRSGTAECTGHGPVIIRNQANYNVATANTTWLESASAGQLLIMWPQITDAQLVTLLRPKTRLAELVIEGSTELTSLSPALDNLVNVSTRIVISRNAGLLSLSLPALRQVGGSMSLVSLGRAANVSIPALLSVGHNLQIQNVRISVLDLNALTTVGGGIDMRGMRSLTGPMMRTALRSLRSIGGAFTIRNVAGWGGGTATTLVLPMLQRAGGINLAESNLQSVSFPALTNITNGGIVLYHMPALTMLYMMQLAAVRGNVRLSVLANIPSICNMSFPLTGFTPQTAGPRGFVIERSPGIRVMDAWVAELAQRPGTTACPTRNPTASPTTVVPTAAPTTLPPTTASPTRHEPTTAPTRPPATSTPTPAPSMEPATSLPSAAPARSPTGLPTKSPSASPTSRPTFAPTVAPAVGETSAQPEQQRSDGSTKDDSSDDDDDSAVIAVVVGMAVVVVTVIVVAVVFVKKSAAATRQLSKPQGFDNPLYDSATGQQHSGAPKYADFSAGQPGKTSGYMDVAPGGVQQSSGYMDVAANTGGASAGYMDVSPGGIDDDEEEDV